MITLTAEIICDTCKQVVACGSCQPIDPNGSYWAHSAIHDAINKAVRRGASVLVATVECAECHAKSTTTTPTIWVIEEKP